MTSVGWLGLLALWLSPLCWGQSDIFLKTGTISPRDERPHMRTYAARRHLLLQFRSYPGPALRAELARRGIRVLEYVPEFALMVSVGERLDLSALNVTWSGALEPRQKISPRLADGQYSAYLVVLHMDSDRDMAAAAVAQLGFQVVEAAGLLARHLLVTGPLDRLIDLAAADEIAYLMPARWDLGLRRPQYHCPGPIVETAPLADYALQGSGWSRESNGQVSLSYFFESLTAKLNPNVVRGEVQRALDEWARFANISFSATQQEGAARSVDILFADGAHGDPYPFDGPGRVLAHTFFPAGSNPEPVAGDMHFDAAESWNVGAGLDLFSVALHEAGHALGLAHSDNPEAVMYPYYKMSTGLSNDDIAGIQALYGKRGAVTPAPPTPPMPVPTPPVVPGPPAAPVPPPAKPTPSGSDHTAPSLSILSPGSTIASTWSASLAMSGTASDNGGVSKVVWTTSTGASGVAAGTTSWTATVPLLVGDNVVTVSVVDASGNSSWRAVTVVRH